MLYSNEHASSCFHDNNGEFCDSRGNTHNGFEILVPSDACVGIAGIHVDEHVDISLAHSYWSKRPEGINYFLVVELVA